MSVAWWNRISGVFMVALSLVALLTLLIGLTRPPEPPGSDEGTLAHIFQLSIGLLLPVGGLFFITADWTAPWRAARPLVVTAVIVAVAFALLYSLEHR